MTPQHTLRRPDQPIQIGPRHGYRIEGDHVFINAELQVPPYHPGGELTLELWATDQPYREGRLTGVKVAQLAVELPTPIGPYLHQVDTRTAARLPLHGRAHAMVLALVQDNTDSVDEQPHVHAFANYAQPQTFTAPHFDGTVGYHIQGSEVVLEAEGIFNPRVGTNLSGTLALELWAFPVSGSSTDGLRLAVAEIERVAGQSHLTAVEQRASFREPPAGRFQMALLLCEWTGAHEYVARDRRDFRLAYERSTPERPSSIEGPATVTVAAPTIPGDRLRLVSPVAPVAVAAASAVAAAPAVTTAAPAVTAQPSAASRPGKPGLVSIQTGSVEELTAVKGLNLKIATAIVKARPFTSLDDMIRVRGLGQKTIDKLKSLLTL